MDVPDGVNRSSWLQALGIVGATVFLTAGFVGVLAVVSGAAVGVEDRLALYVLVAGVVFVTAIVTLTRRGLDGGTVLLATVGGSLLCGVLVLFAGEGVRYAVVRPGSVFRLQMLAYFAAAGLVVVGLTYWTLRFWRDLLAPAADGPDPG
ncbi:MAG: hypothetical protein ABEJ70_01295 [Halobacteriaceae archaeon]